MPLIIKNTKTNTKTDYTWIREIDKKFVETESPVQSVNGKDGNVILTSDDIISGSTNFFVNSDQNDALDNSASPSAVNPFFTRNENIRYNVL